MSTNDKRRVVLTEREIETLWLLAEGLSNKLIAERMNVSEHTVKFHVTSLTKKFGTNRTRAVVEFLLAFNPEALHQRLPQRCHVTTNVEVTVNEVRVARREVAVADAR